MGLNAILLAALFMTLASHFIFIKAQKKPVPAIWKRQNGYNTRRWNNLVHMTNQIKQEAAKQRGRPPPPLGFTNRIGDIALSESHGRAWMNKLRHGRSRRFKRSLVDFGLIGHQKWASPIKYVIGGEFNPLQEMFIDSAIQTWETEVACITFQKMPTMGSIPSTEPYLLFIQDDFGDCYSYIGRTISSGSQVISIAGHCLDWKSESIHVIGHALGLINQHQRNDRGSYLAIKYGNTAYVAALEVDPAAMTPPPVPFDYGSLMMHESTYESNNYQNTINTTDARYQQSLGQKVGLAIYDIRAITEAYCQPAPCAGGITCNAGGFLIPPSCNTCKCPKTFTGPTCDVPVSVGTTAGGTITVNSATLTCITSANYATGGLYYAGVLANWVLTSNTAGFEIEGSFTQTAFGILAKTTALGATGPCIHLIEVNTNTGFIPSGYKFCGTTAPTYTFTGASMLLSFDASTPITDLPLTVPVFPWNMRGFQFCYKLKAVQAPHINRCLGVNCGPNGRCNEIPLGFVCACDVGFRGTFCEKIDRCVSNQCGNGGACMDGISNFECVCTVGYHGSTCTDHNGCQNNPCANGETCIDLAGSAVNGYTCVSGFTGTNCQTSNLCNPPCLNGGTCKTCTSGLLCDCQPGFYGVQCQNHLGCQTNPCKNGGTCTNTDQSPFYVCHCSPLYYGATCKKFNSCYQPQCQNGGHCQDSMNGYSCVCQAGFYGWNCENANDCVPHPKCPPTETCEDLNGGFNCWP